MLQSLFMCPLLAILCLTGLWDSDDSSSSDYLDPSSIQSLSHKSIAIIPAEPPSKFLDDFHNTDSVEPPSKFLDDFHNTDSVGPPSKFLDDFRIIDFDYPNLDPAAEKLFDEIDFGLTDNDGDDSLTLSSSSSIGDLSSFYDFDRDEAAQPVSPGRRLRRLTIPWRLTPFVKFAEYLDDGDRRLWLAFDAEMRCELHDLLRVDQVQDAVTAFARAIRSAKLPILSPTLNPALVASLKTVYDTALESLAAYGDAGVNLLALVTFALFQGKLRWRHFLRCIPRSDNLPEIMILNLWGELSQNETTFVHEDDEVKVVLDRLRGKMTTAAIEDIFGLQGMLATSQAELMKAGVGYDYAVRLLRQTMKAAGWSIRVFGE